LFPVHLKLKIEFNFQIGHYCPSCGTILIDGREIQDYDHKYLHEKIAMVGQEPILFKGGLTPPLTS
jgi:ABC-type bacteriocin/lantibiotic exporter with double-glycine peptidase domain